MRLHKLNGAHLILIKPFVNPLPNERSTFIEIFLANRRNRHQVHGYGWMPALVGRLRIRKRIERKTLTLIKLNPSAADFIVGQFDFQYKISTFNA